MKAIILPYNGYFCVISKTVFDTLRTDDFNSEEIAGAAICTTSSFETATKIIAMFDSNSDVIAAYNSLAERNDYPHTQNERPLIRIGCNDEQKQLEVRYYERWYWDNYTVEQSFQIA